jgi:betaine-aldehyde dehydrogenase
MYQYDKLFIGGEWIAPTCDTVIEVISPHSQQVVGQVPDGSRGDIDSAVDAARKAFEGPWGRTSPDERAEVIDRLLNVWLKRSDDLANAMVAEMGVPVSQVRGLHIDAGAAGLEYYAGLARTFSFEERREGILGTSVVRRLPVGVVGAIIPWNGSPFLTVMKLGPALAAGCTMVLKPAPEAPITSFLLAEACIEAQLPPGVLNIVPAGREVGEYLVTHPATDKISFTGSSNAGRRIASLCGDQLKRVTLELGGKSAAIILDDADVDGTLEGLKIASFANNGQVCAANTRLLVPAQQYDDWVDAIAGLAASLPVGDPFDPTTWVGPLVAERQRARVEGYIQVGVAEGAKVVTGGKRPAEQRTGWYVEPTVFADVDNGMRIAREEIFGPVVAVIPYRDEADATAIANDSEYGLHGSVWTEDLAHGLEIAKQVRTGTLAINGFGVDMTSPFGGMKGSGLGREMGPEGLQAYLEDQSILLVADDRHH